MKFHLLYFAPFWRQKKSNKSGISTNLSKQDEYQYQGLKPNWCLFPFMTDLILVTKCMMWNWSMKHSIFYSCLSAQWPWYPPVGPYQGQTTLSFLAITSCSRGMLQLNCVTSTLVCPLTSPTSALSAAPWKRWPTKASPYFTLTALASFPILTKTLEKCMMKICRK